MSSDEEDSNSDSFVDAQDTLYDSRGHPLNFRYSSVLLSSAPREPSRDEALRVQRTQISRQMSIPEISITDTSLESGKGFTTTLLSSPTGQTNTEREIPDNAVRPLIQKTTLVLSQAQNHLAQQIDDAEEPEVTVYIKDHDAENRSLPSDIDSDLEKPKRRTIDPLSFHIIKLNNPTHGDDATLSGDGENTQKIENLEFEISSDGEQHKGNNEKDPKSHRFSLLDRIKRRTSRHEKNEDQEQDENMLTGNNAPVFSQSLGEYGRAQPRYIKVRMRNKVVREFNRLFLAQELFNPVPVEPNKDTDKSSAIWAMEFSKDGKSLATGGRDGVVRVWVVISSDEEREHFMEGGGNSVYEGQSGAKLGAPVFRDKPLYEYIGHTADVLDLSWSKNNFLLSSSMDKTVRLWHLTRKECLCCFQHTEFVTAIAFHPKDDRFFLSGSLDRKLRLWNIPEKGVTYWKELAELITAVGFTHDGKIAAAGSFTGLCFFFETEGLNPYTQIHVRSSRGHNSKGSKITGIEPMPGTLPGHDKLLISSNDSRIRLYNLRDKSLECKYKGLENACSQIRATFSDDGRYIICGSENRQVYIWNTDQSSIHLSMSGNSGSKWLKKDKIGFEAFEAHSDVVTSAIFAPTQTKKLIAMTGDPIFVNTLNKDSNGDETPPSSQNFEDGNIIVCADFTGSIKIFRNDSSYYPQYDGDAASVRSTRSWNSTLGSLLNKGRRRRASESSSLYSFSTSSAISIDGAIDEQDDVAEEMRCECSSTNFKAFIDKSSQKSKLICAHCGKSAVQ